MLFIVTVKLPKNVDHNPRDKQYGGCPVSPLAICTDTTGEHHSILVQADDSTSAHTVATRNGYKHITRIEATDLPLI